jgi:hypothetical protein
MLKPLYKIGLLLTSIILFSCEGEIGMNGIVKNSKTGEIIEDVRVEMNSEYKILMVLTDSLGRFYTRESFSCGAKKCSEDFTISFDKGGFEHLELDQNFCLAGESVDSCESQMTVVKLTPIDTAN